MPKSGEVSESHLKRDVLVAAFIASTPVIMRHVMSIVKHPEDAEDVMQETFYKALRAFPNFRSDSQISSWLFRVAHNKALNRLDLSHRRHEIPYEPNGYFGISHNASPEAEIIQSEEIMAVIEELKALSLPQQKTVLMQAYGLSIEEITMILDMKEGTVKSHASRGRAKLQKNRKTA